MILISLWGFLICLLYEVFNFPCWTLFLLIMHQLDTESSLKMVEEISVNCQCVGGDSLLCVSKCCQSVAIHVLLQGSRGEGNHWAPCCQTKPIICSSAKAERRWPTLTTILIICAVISISLDLLRSFWLAGNLQQMPTVTSWLQILDTSFFYARMQALMQWWDKWLNVNCDYVEVSCVPCHVCTEVRIKCSASKCLLPYVFETPL